MPIVFTLDAAPSMAVLAVTALAIYSSFTLPQLFWLHRPIVAIDARATIALRFTGTCLAALIGLIVSAWAGLRQGREC